jgi:hypothetical protein
LKSSNKLCPFNKLSVFYNSCLKTVRSHPVCYPYIKCMSYTKSLYIRQTHIVNKQTFFISAVEKCSNKVPYNSPNKTLTALRPNDQYEDQTQCKQTFGSEKPKHKAKVVAPADNERLSRFSDNCRYTKHTLKPRLRLQRNQWFVRN